MELFKIMQSTFSAREFTKEPFPDETLYKILDNARFAPSGGNRQGWRVIIARDTNTRKLLSELAIPASKRYTAQRKHGENPWNSIDPTSIDTEVIESTPAPTHLTQSYLQASVVLIVCVDLKVVASIDQYLDRVGVVSGASIYPFVWNILLAANNEGYGGTITTLAIAQESELQKLLGIPNHYAVCSLIPLGKPLKRLTKLKRKSVPDFATHEHWDGNPLVKKQEN